MAVSEKCQMQPFFLLTSRRKCNIISKCDVKASVPDISDEFHEAPKLFMHYCIQEAHSFVREEIILGGFQDEKLYGKSIRCGKKMVCSRCRRKNLVTSCI